MAYVAVKGGERAIDAAHAWLAEERRGDPAVAAAAAWTRSNGSSAAPWTASWPRARCYDRELAALAIKQAQGDLIEAAFLLRAYRATLPRFAHCRRPLDTAAMHVTPPHLRRCSRICPGGQVLGPTYDYTHRLLDPSLAVDAPIPPAPPQRRDADLRATRAARVSDILGHEGLMEAGRAPPRTRRTVRPHARRRSQFPAGRDVRLAGAGPGRRGLHARAWATRPSVATVARIPFVGELRLGDVVGRASCRRSWALHARHRRRSR